MAAKKPNPFAKALAKVAPKPAAKPMLRMDEVRKAFAAPLPTGKKRRP